MVIIAVDTRIVDIDLIDLYRKEIRILGSDSRKLGVVESARLLKLIRPYFESKAFHPRTHRHPALRVSSPTRQCNRAKVLIRCGLGS